MNKFFQSDKIYHLFIWLLLIVPRGIGGMYIAKSSLSLYFFNMLTLNGMLLFLVYFNLLYLIPRYFKTGKYKQYIAFISLLSILQIIGTSYVNAYVSGRMNTNELSDWQFEIPFYFFNTSQYLVISFLLYALQERYSQRKLISEIEVEKLNAEVKYLKAQINPHFLFNTLNNLYALSLEKSDQAPETILMLSKMMDYMLYETSESKVSLQKEIENIENYIGLERIRQGNQAIIEYSVFGQPEEKKIVPLILLPIIENAFKHGISQLIHGAWVRIKINILPDQLELEAENNYKKKTEDKNHGIGLSNLKKQLDVFYPGRHELIVRDDGEVYQCRLKLGLA